MFKLRNKALYIFITLSIMDFILGLVLGLVYGKGDQSILFPLAVCSGAMLAVMNRKESYEKNRIYACIKQCACYSYVAFNVIVVTFVLMLRIYG